MSRGYDVPAQHQQVGGMIIQEFADKEGLTLKQAMTAARGGKILGARQDGRSKRWWVYPPAKLLERPRSYKRRSVADGSLVVDFGTSPHGLSAGLPEPVHETCGTLGLLPPAKPVLPVGDARLPDAEPRSTMSAAAFASWSAKGWWTWAT